MKKILLILPCFLLIIGCENERKSLSFNSLSIEKIDDKNCEPEKENCTYIHIEVPQAEETTPNAKNINEEIRKHVIDLIDYKEERKYETLEEFSLHFINDYELAVKEFPEEKTPWEAQVEGNVVYKTIDLLSVKFSLELFTGGAHGYGSTSYLNFDPVTGKLFHKADLFKPEFKDFAETLFRKKYEIPKDDNINSTGYFFKNDTFQLPENIGFQKDSVILQYNPYEVASYADGSFQLKISRKKVDDFLKIKSNL